jgi:LPS O-antigen subunit length determinant protein (WzzB/FepE family)
MKSNQTELAKQNLNYQYDDEIDLFEVFEVAWQEKVTVILFIIAFLFASLIYAFSATTMYKIKISYVQNIDERDGRGVNVIFADIITAGGKIITKKKRGRGDVVVVTSNVEEFSNIDQQLKLSNQKYTLDLINNAEDKLLYLINGIPDGIKSTEVVAKSYVQNKGRLILLKREGFQALTIGKSAVSVKPPKTKQIIAVSVVLGGMIGLFYIFLRRGIMNYKEKQKTRTN